VSGLPSSGRADCEGTIEASTIAVQLTRKRRHRAVVAAPLPFLALASSVYSAILLTTGGSEPICGFTCSSFITAVVSGTSRSRHPFADLHQHISCDFFIFSPHGAGS
jgi:hypothetical protein